MEKGLVSYLCVTIRRVSGLFCSRISYLGIFVVSCGDNKDDNAKIDRWFSSYINKLTIDALISLNVMQNYMQNL
jgi:hypothetical protein